MRSARHSRCTAGESDTYTSLPTIYLYDRYPGGIGLSERLYELHDVLLKEAAALIAACECANGCPACVGPAEEVGMAGKQLALRLVTEATLAMGDEPNLFTGTGATETNGDLDFLLSTEGDGR